MEADDVVQPCFKPPGLGDGATLAQPRNAIGNLSQGDRAEVAMLPVAAKPQGDSVLKQVDKIGLAVGRRPDSRCCANRAEVVADVVGGG